MMREDWGTGLDISELKINNKQVSLGGGLPLNSYINNLALLLHKDDG